MEPIHLHIKNMVCNRCIKVVKEELEKLDLKVAEIKLGEAVIAGENENIDLEQVRKVLEENGFELLDDRKALLIEKIKNLVIEVVHQKENVDIHVNFSHLIQ